MHIDFHTHEPFDGLGVFLDHYKLGEDLPALLAHLQNIHLAAPLVKHPEEIPILGAEISVSMYYKSRRRIPLEIQEKCWVVGSIHTYKNSKGEADPHVFCDILDFYGDQIDHLAHPFQHELEKDVPLHPDVRERFVSILRKHSLPTEFNQRHMRNNGACRQFVHFMSENYPEGMLISTDSHHEMQKYRMLKEIIPIQFWALLNDPHRARKIIAARSNRPLMEVATPVAIVGNGESFFP